MPDIVKVAITQHEPFWFDLAATVTKTCTLIHEAAAASAKLIVFPEVWISGYPAWIWCVPSSIFPSTHHSLT
jgi:nitrilase